MENMLLQKDSEIEVGKKRSSLWFILFALFIILVLSIVLFYFKDRLTFFNSGRNTVKDNVSTQTNVPNPFEELVGEDVDKQRNDIPLKIEKSVNFVLANKKVSADKRPVIEEGDVVLEILGDGDSRTYKVIASKNSFFKYTVGDEFDFNPKIKPESLFVIRETNIIYQSTDVEVEGFKIPDDLKSGDKVVFNCESPTCEDGVLSWALVFENY